MPDARQVFVLVITHRHGVNVSVHASEGAAITTLHDYARSWWHEPCAGVPPDAGTPQAVIDTYFDAVADEWYSLTECPVKFDPVDGKSGGDAGAVMRSEAPRCYLGITSSGAFDWNGDCDAAVLTVTPRDAQRWLLRMDALADLQRRLDSPAVYGLQELDESPVILPYAALADTIIDSEGEWTELSADAAGAIERLAGETKLPRVEGMTANFSESAVYWTLYPKYTDIEVTTPVLNRETLAVIAGVPATSVEGLVVKGKRFIE